MWNKLLIILLISFSVSAEARTYTTNFSVSENPISEAGVWTGPGASWTAVSTVGGFAHGTQTGSGGFDDSYAFLSGFANDHQVEAVLKENNPSPSGNVEVELLLRWSRSGGNTYGYEIDFWGAGHNLSIARWDGAKGVYTVIYGPNYSVATVDGDTVRAKIIGSTITVYKIHLGVTTTICTVTDATYATGQPGIGFYIDSPASNTDFGFSSFSATDGIADTTPTISNVTGTISTGQTLTITGTNMVQENKTSWLNLSPGGPNFSSGSAYGFEGTSPSTDLYWAGGDHGCSYDTSVKLMGNNSYKCTVSGRACQYGGLWDNTTGGCVVYGDPCPSGHSCVSQSYVADYSSFGINNNNYYGRAYFRYTNTSGVVPNEANKMFILSANNGEIIMQPEPNQVSVPETVDANNEIGFSAQVMKSNGDKLKYTGAFPGNLMEMDRWYLLEWYLNQPGGTFQLWIDGIQYVNTPTATTGYSYNYTDFGIVNAKNVISSSFSETLRMDGFTLSSTRIGAASVIEVSGDGFSPGHPKYQEPLTLGDTSSQIKLDLTGLTGTNYQLRITNNQQQTSSVYNLTGGDTPTNVAPTIAGIGGGGNKGTVGSLPYSPGVHFKNSNLTMQ